MRKIVGPMHTTHSNEHIYMHMCKHTHACTHVRMHTFTMGELNAFKLLATGLNNNPTVHSQKYTADLEAAEDSQVALWASPLPSPGLWSYRKMGSKMYLMLIQICNLMHDGM